MTMPEREAVTVELDVEVATMLREHAAAENVSEGEIVERALRAADLRALVSGSALVATSTRARRCVSSKRN